jgi:membrane associated rhomboid family serine protease
VRFSALYFVSIVGSGLSVLTFNYAVPTLGASGAIFGLFGALVAVGLRMGQRGRGLIGQVLPIIVINLIFTYSVPGISAAAHVGGLLTGFVAGLVLYMVPTRRRSAEYAYAFDPAQEPAATIEQQQPPPQAPE